ncbi:MAG TPA: methyltransferase domain-containing protein, partial [Arenicellales bacterium]|nr:methyltransferase domain-containing protein [Arenicellales bacterium]
MTRDALAAAARRAVEEGRLDAARPMWSRLCELEPNEIDHWIILSAIDEHLGFLPAALEHVAYAARLNAEDPDVWLQTARVRWRMRDLGGAISDLGRALALDFSNADARLLFGAWLLEWHRFEEALVHYRFLQRAGIDLPRADIVKAAACAWCAADSDALDSIAAEHARAAGGCDALADAVARELRALLAPGERQAIQASWKPGVTGSALAAAVQRYVDQDAGGFDWQAFFERRAHVDAVLADDALPEVHDALARELASRARSLHERPLRVLDLGCGTGRLGEALTESGGGFLLTGIDCCGEMIRVANAGNRYDNLLCAAIEDSSVLKLVSGADCILLADVLPYCRDPRAAAALVIESASPGATLWLTWDPRAPGVDGLEAAVRGAANAGRRACSSVDIPGRVALTVAGRRPAAASGSRATSPQHGRDELEQAANRLVEAERLFAAARFDECHKASLAILRDYPCSSQALLHLGVAAQHHGRLDEALYWFRQALRQRTGFAAAWFQVGAVYQQKNAPAPAAYAYRHCVRCDPGNFAALHNLAALERARGNRDAAWQAQRALLARHALGVERHIEELRQTLDRDGDNESRRKLEDFLAGDDWLRARLGQALERKFVSRAGKLLARLSRAGGGEAELLFYQAQLAEKSGDPDSAVRSGLALLRHDRGNPVYWQFVASACAAGGRLEASRRVWRAAAGLAGADCQVLQNGLFFLNYSPVLSAASVAAKHHDWGRALSAKFDAPPAGVPRTPRQRGRIRIGYVSADFRMHSVAVFLYNIL